MRNKRIHKIALLVIAVTLLYAIQCSTPQKEKNRFISVCNTQLIRNSQPYYYIGTNFWYAPILGSTGEGGNRERLHKELDKLKEMGIENLRILAGADAGSANANSVKPYLQPSPGVLNDTLLIGLDYTLAELEKRGMTAVIYLTNSWDWSGGYGFYLRECGYGDSPNASGEGYNEYVRYSAQFVKDERAKELYLNQVKTIVSRTNSITGRKYSEEPSIMAWQICNEPRPFSKEGKQAFAEWIATTAATIKSIDGNHLVSTGSEGLYGCETDEELCEKIHADKNIDYLTIHIWPLNWGWASRTEPDSSIYNACRESSRYIALHMEMSKRINKPLVIEEFGYSRQANRNSLDANVTSRDIYYDYIFNHVETSATENGVIAGCNFWGWGGAGRADDSVWNPGDDYLCDPPHEPQGWYSVFDCDSTTISIIKESTSKVKGI
ncbi:MAG: cellulase family glycosylhydrolase [Bacteroidaceae bacterium]|nr:cellulase family glycosylhydrolase [Bacteroidaceae bacterium]